MQAKFKRFGPTTGWGAALLTMAVLLALPAVPASARVVLQSRGPRHLTAPSHHEFVFEAALAEPMGDQADDFLTSDNGFGSSTGYELGVRYRYYLGGALTVSPHFHYTRFGDAEGVAEFGDPAEPLWYSLRTSNYRYGVDLQAFMAGPGANIRPYLFGGVNLINNRYRDELQYEGVFTTSMNTPAWSAGVGFKMNVIEISAEYVFNRFSTSNLTPATGSVDYDWDYVAVRFGLAFGR